jgi:hypothetical protein
MLRKVEQCAGDLRGLLVARRAHEVIVHKMMKRRPVRLDMNPDPEVLGYPIDKKRETSAGDGAKITKARRGQISQQGTSDDNASNDNNKDDVVITDNTTYTFLDHDPVVLARLPANIRSPRNSVQTTQKGMTASFLNFIVSLAARKMSFHRFEACAWNAKNQRFTVDFTTPLPLPQIIMPKQTSTM